jgi:hypothetical protein
MKQTENTKYCPTQKAINAKNKTINKSLHVKGKKTTKKVRNKK